MGEGPASYTASVHSEAIQGPFKGPFRGRSRARGHSGSIQGPFRSPFKGRPGPRSIQGPFKGLRIPFRGHARGHSGAVPVAQWGTTSGFTSKGIQVDRRSVSRAMPNLLLTRESPHYSRVPALGLGSNWRRMRHLKKTTRLAPHALGYDARHCQWARTSSGLSLRNVRAT